VRVRSRPEGTVGMSSIAARRAAAAANAKTNSSYQERRAAIRHAAGEVFHRKGFHATTLSDVAEAVGMDRASLYYYVGSKEQLFRDIVADAVKRNVADVERLAAEDLPAKDRLATLIQLLMESFEREYPHLYVFVQEDVRRLEKQPGAGDDTWMTAVHKWDGRYVRAVRTIVSQGLANGELDSDLPAAVVTSLIIGMVNSSYAWFRPDGPMSGTDIGKTIAKMVLNGLSAKVDRSLK
jgi:AcrR family transcriptional regulator